MQSFFLLILVSCYWQQRLFAVVGPGQCQGARAELAAAMRSPPTSASIPDLLRFKTLSFGNRFTMHLFFCGAVFCGVSLCALDRCEGAREKLVMEIIQEYSENRAYLYTLTLACRQPIDIDIEDADPEAVEVMSASLHVPKLSHSHPSHGILITLSLLGLAPQP
jgi:hypothetical protein